MQKIRLTKTRWAVVALLICIVTVILLFQSSNQTPDSILKHIETLRHQGYDLDAVEKQLGKPHIWGRASSSGTSPPKLRHYISSSWFFVRNANPLDCEICMITVYAMGDGSIVDSDMQTEVLAGVNNWKCIWHRITGNVGNVYSMLKMRTKSPL